MAWSVVYVFLVLNWRFQAICEISLFLTKEKDKCLQESKKTLKFFFFLMNFSIHSACFGFSWGYKERRTKRSGENRSCGMGSRVLMPLMIASLMLKVTYELLYDMRIDNVVLLLDTPTSCDFLPLQQCSIHWIMCDRVLNGILLLRFRFLLERKCSFGCN